MKRKKKRKKKKKKEKCSLAITGQTAGGIYTKFQRSLVTPLVVHITT
jgi:hypothetical protein